MSLNDYFLMQRSYGRTFYLSENVADGIVEKFLIFSNEMAGLGEVSEFSILKVCANSKIKLHKHEIAEEDYIFINWDLVFKCKCGMSHSFENTTNEDIYILTIKRKVQ